MPKALWGREAAVRKAKPWLLKKTIMKAELVNTRRRRVIAKSDLCFLRKRSGSRQSDAVTFEKSRGKPKGSPRRGGRVYIGFNQKHSKIKGLWQSINNINLKLKGNIATFLRCFFVGCTSQKIIIGGGVMSGERNNQRSEKMWRKTAQIRSTSGFRGVFQRLE